MRRVLILCSMVLLLTPSAFCGDVHSRIIDTAYHSDTSPAIAIGPNREVAIIFASADTVFGYLSIDNGRTFTRTSFDHSWSWGYTYEVEMGPADVAFDHRGNLYLFWVIHHVDDHVDWQYYRVARSSDGGKTFETQRIWHISQLLNNHYSFDDDDNVLLVGTHLPYEHYFAAAYSVPDSSFRRMTELTFPSADPFRGGGEAIAYADSMDVAFNSWPSYPPIGLIYYRFPNSADTVSPAMIVGTEYAENLRFLGHSNGRSLLATTHSQSTLKIRTVGDSSISEPVFVKDDLHMYAEPASIHKRDSSIFFAYYRYQYPDSGVCVLQMNESSGEVVDSIYLPGHRSPGLATDSLNGKYLVSIYQNKLYFTTKDVVLKVGDDRSTLPSSFTLSQNHPNPFNPSTSISFSIPTRAFVTLSIFNLLGQQVARLVDEEKTPGEYTVEWDAQGMSSGVYFYRIDAGSFSVTKKMLLVR